MVETTLREYAIRVFGGESLAMKWLVKPVRELDGKRPIDVDIKTASELLARLEHGFAS
ncbi:MbcA/ParS/Xre antitoxin family protein [Pseudomonas cichorii]|nr:MbcA/ParS/Xre antitoxin family protein [Pseudomonas cichorii]